MKRFFSLLVVLALVVGACGDDAAPETTSTTVATGFPVVVRGVTIDERPARIVSGSATHTEILFAVGAGDRVVAVDDFSDFPAVETAALPHFDAFNASVEGIAEFDPDLVILAFDPGDVAAGLSALGIATIVFDAPAVLDDAFVQWQETGDAVGQSLQADALIYSVRDEIEQIVFELPVYVRPFSYYHELDDTYFSIGSDTFLGSVYGMMTMVSIADAAGGGYPQLSAEFIIDADPDFIFLADGETAESVASRPGWSEMTAVQTGSIIDLDPAVASRWGWRIIELFRLIDREVHGVGG